MNSISFSGWRDHSMWEEARREAAEQANRCFRPYSVTFQTPFEQYRERNGEPAEVIRPLADEEIGDVEEVGRMYLIRFEDGVEIHAWPEEIGIGEFISGQGKSFDL